MVRCGGADIKVLRRVRLKILYRSLNYKLSRSAPGLTPLPGSHTFLWSFLSLSSSALFSFHSPISLRDYIRRGFGRFGWIVTIFHIPVITPCTAVTYSGAFAALPLTALPLTAF